MKKFIKWIFGIPHLFAKLIVVACLICIIYFSERSLDILEATGYDSSPHLVAIASVFGGELLFLVLKTIFEKKKNKASKMDAEEDEVCCEE